MKKTLIVFLLIFFTFGIRAGKGEDFTPPSGSGSQFDSGQILEKAKSLFESEKGKVEQYWQKIRNEDIKADYDTILGPYFVVSQRPDLNPGYLCYFAKQGNITGQAVIDSYGMKGDISIFPKGKTKYTTLVLDFCAAEQKFYEKFPDSKKAVLAQLVFPARFWGPSFITHLPAVWWLIDDAGNCYYITLTGDIFSFSELAGKAGQKVPGVIYDDDPGTQSSIEGGSK